MQFSYTHYPIRLMATVLSAAIFQLVNFLGMTGFIVGASFVIPIIAQHPTAPDVFSYLGLALAAGIPWFVTLPPEEKGESLAGDVTAAYVKHVLKLAFIGGVAYWIVAIIIMMILPGVPLPADASAGSQ